MISLPSQSQCLSYFEEYKVPRNILAHCKAVQEVSMFLAQELVKNGTRIEGKPVDVDFVRALSVLHDLFKAVTLKELNPNHKYHPYAYSDEEIAKWKELRLRFAGKYEGEIAYEVFGEQYPRLAASLRKASAPGIHVVDKTFEENLVHYIDWRVLKTEIIGLRERLAYLREMYPHAILRHEEEQEMLDFEVELFSHLSFTAQDLKQEFENHLRRVTGE
ncbi:hypothetical protein HYV86_03775 [Candidatus Woesearchaeota archaeon]|nr:hypothetical protein [Candidatus Woesearchaeota archaeon]